MPTRVKQESGDAIEERLARHKGDIARLIEELKTADAGEKEELRTRIKTLEDQIASDKKAKEQKEKDEGTGGTLVLPPEQVPQGQQHGDDDRHEPAGEVKPPAEGGKRKGGWKKAW